MERVTEPTLLSLLGGQGLDGLEVEVVVEMEVVEVLSVNQQVQHIVALSAHLQTCLHPIQAGGLEELGGLEGPEQITLLLRLRRPVLQRIEDKVLEQLLVADSDLDRLTGGTVLSVPCLHQGNVQVPPCPARPEVEWPRGPHERDPVGRDVGVERGLLQEGDHVLRQLKLLVVVRQLGVQGLLGVSVRDWVDERIKVEGR